MSTTGNAGVLFDITEQNVTTATGNVTQEHSIATAVAQLTIATTDIVYSVSGSVGTTAFDFDVTSVNNQSGTGYSTTVIRNNSGDFVTLKSLVIYNTHATNNLIIGSPAANSLFTWHSTSDYIYVEPGQAMTFVYSTAKSVGSNGKINIKGSSSATTFQIFILGA